jgi:hypothetical protein
MARLRIISDVHSEFHADAGRSFVTSLPDVPCDAVVVAGDVGDSRTALPFMRVLCDRFAGTPVLYVTGNNEHYGSSVGAVRTAVARASRTIRNLVHLDNTVVDVAGVRVAGATLWFPYDPMNDLYRRNMADYRAVRDLDITAYAENDRTRRFIGAAGGARGGAPPPPGPPPRPPRPGAGAVAPSQYRPLPLRTQLQSDERLDKSIV